MRSSTTTVVRAVVMLACLVLIPLIALSPESVVKLFNGEWGSAAPPSENSLTEAPKFHPEEEVPSFAGEAGRVEQGMAVSNPVGLPPATEIPVGYNAPVAAANPRTPDPMASVPGLASLETGRAGFGSAGLAGQSSIPPGPPGQLPGETMAPGPAYPQPLAGVKTAGPAEVAAPKSLGSPPSPSEGGSFTLIQERLRDLGAVYYRLESWGSQQQLFRFQCEMSVAGSPGLTRHFEAVDGHPLLAMHKVLVEAEAWHATR